MREYITANWDPHGKAEGALDTLVAERDRLRKAICHVIEASPGTPDSAKKYLLRELEGSWGEPYEQMRIG